jgi:Ca2+-binding EF-hand superfamily protein
MPPLRPGAFPGGPAGLLRNIETFDSDGDGALSREEYEAAVMGMFLRIDANADGKLEPAEMAQRGVGDMMISPAVRERRLLRLYDRNDDGKITPDECLVPPKAFAPLDANNSGALESEDLLKLNFTSATILEHPNYRAVVLLGELDASGDGRLSPAEFRWPEAVLQKADRNGDKTLDREELNLLPPLPLDHPRRRAEELIAEADLDGDGMLSENEFRRRGGQFDQVDADKDGLIEVRELVAWFEKGGGARFRARASRVRMVETLFDRFDANRDGKLTGDELQRLPEPMRRQWDQNGDGEIEFEEVERVMDERGAGGPRDAPGARRVRNPIGQIMRGTPAETVVKDADQDKDGKLSLEELGIGGPAFERIDGDGDGKISVDELDAAGELIRAGQLGPMDPGRRPRRRVVPPPAP